MKKWLKNISAITGILSLGIALFLLFLPYGVYLEYHVKFNPKQALAFVATKAPIEYSINVSEADQGVTGSGRTIKAFIDAIGGTRKATIKILHTEKTTFSTYTLTTNETVTSNIAIDVDHGAILDGAGTLTSNGPFDHGLSQCFGASIAINFGAGSVEKAYSEWWGENTTPGTTDMATEIRAALDSGADIVQLLDTTYRFDTGLLVDDEKLVGKGSYKTHLEYNTEAGTAITLNTNRGGELSGFTLEAKGITQSGIIVTGAFPIISDVMIYEFDGTSLQLGNAGTSGCYYPDMHNIYIVCTANTGTIGLLIDGQSAPNANANDLYGIAIIGDFTTLIHIKGNKNNIYGGDASWGVNTPTDVIKIEGIGNQIDNIYMEGSGEPTRLFHFTSTAYKNRVKFHNQFGSSVALNIDEKTLDSGWANELITNGSVGHNFPFPAENKGIENLIPNSHFKIWNAAGNLPVGWKASVATIAKEATIIRGANYSAKFTGAATNPSILCYLNDSDSTCVTDNPIEQFQGEIIMAGVWCRTSVANAGNIKVYTDGTGGGGFGLNSHTGGDTWEFLTAMGKIPSDATYVFIQLKGKTTGNITGDVYFSEPIAVKGIHLPKPNPRSLNDSFAKFCGPEVHAFITLPDDATPSVKDGSLFLTGGTTTITDFDDGYEGQIIRVVAEHSLTITDGTNIFLDGSANWAMTATDTLSLVCKADNKWYELGRGDNGA